MKTGDYAAFYAVISNMAVGLCFVPLLFLAWKKIRHVGVYRAIALYWLINGLINIPNLGIAELNINIELEEKVLSWYNLLDTPLVLLIFASAATGRLRKRIIGNIIFFILLELALVRIMGYRFITSSLITGAGLALILLYCINGLVQYMKQMEHSDQENAMAFVYAALLFAYVSFLIIFVFIHFQESGQVGSKDSFLLYYISLLLSATITCLGLWGYGIRRPQPLVRR